MDTSSPTADQLTALLNQSQGGASLFDMDKLTAALMPFMVALTVLSIVLTILYVFHLIQKIRVDKAILETRDIVREINDREKAKLQTPLPQAAPTEHETPDVTVQN